MPSIKVIERFGRVAPLGIQFIDASTGLPIRSGLQVIAYPEITPHIRLTLVPNRSGVFVLHKAPGLGDFTNSTGEDEDWNNAPYQNYRITVDDLERRYIPCQFMAEVPHRGRFELNCLSSPLEPAGAVPLFPLSHRSIAASRAILRADIYDIDNDTPAKWAVVEIAHEGTPLATGLTDENGKIALDFAYPELMQSGLGSPPTGSATVLSGQTWSVTVRIRYDQPPETQDRLEICQALQQTTADIWQEWSNGSGVSPLPAQTLEYSKPLVLRTIDVGASPVEKTLSVLYVTE